MKYSSINSNPNLKFELEELNFALEQLTNKSNMLLSSKTQRECILNFIEFMREVRCNEILNYLFSKIDNNKRNFFSLLDIGSIRELFRIHLRTELFAISDEPLKYNAVEVLYKNSLLFKMQEHAKYWSLYKAYLILEQYALPQNQTFLKQTVRNGNKGEKFYDFSPSFGKLVYELAKNEQSGIWIETKEIIKLKKNTLHEMQIAYNNFHKHLELEKPVNDVIYRVLYDFQSTEQNCLKSSFGIVEKITQGTCVILHSISNHKTQQSLKFVNGAADITKDGHIHHFTFAYDNSGYENKKHSFKSIKELELQECLDYIISPYEILTDSDNFLEKIPGGYDDLSRLIITSYHEELIDLVDSKKDFMNYLKHPDPVEFKICLSRISNEIKKQIDLMIKGNIESEKLLDSHFDHTSLMLRVAGKNIQMKPKSKQDTYITHMLKEMFNFDGSVVPSEDCTTTETHDFVEMYGEYIGIEIKKATELEAKSIEQITGEKRGYNGLRGLKRRLKEYEVPDAFVGDRGKIQPNPKYFRIPCAKKY